MTTDQDENDPRLTELRALTTPPTEHSRYAVPLSTLIAGAYVAVTEQVQEQPSSTPHDWAAGMGPIPMGDGGHGGDGGDGG
jgi:hypothetical protein